MSRQENNIENDFIRKLEELGYQYRPDIKDNTTLNQNFREKFEVLNHVKLTNNEFKRILEPSKPVGLLVPITSFPVLRDNSRRMTGMGQSNLLTSKLVCINPILWFKVVFV
jgi:hypothetical protein